MKQAGATHPGTAVPTTSTSHTHHVAILDAPVVHAEEVDAKLDAAREQLNLLRRQQEDLERKKTDLEDLRRKQDEYTRGRTEMTEHLTRSLAILEREQINAQRLAELCDTTTDNFRDALDQLQSINDAAWTHENVRTELSHALGVVETSRLEFNRARTKLECLDPKPGQEAPAAAATGSNQWPELLRYAKLGAAASAPLIIAGTIWVILLLTRAH